MANQLCVEYALICDAKGPFYKRVLDNNTYRYSVKSSLSLLLSYGFFFNHFHYLLKYPFLKRLGEIGTGSYYVLLIRLFSFVIFFFFFGFFTIFFFFVLFTSFSRRSHYRPAIMTSIYLKNSHIF